MLKKTLVIVLLIILGTQSIMMPLAEAHVWEERRQSLEASNQPERVAALGITNNPVSFLNTFPSAVSPSTSSQVSKTKASFSQPHVSGISSKFFKVKDIFEGSRKDKPTLYLIQDVHLHSEAQKNISLGLLQFLDGKKSAFIGVEGAFGEFDFSSFHAFPDQQIVRDVADSFIKKNYMGAPSYVGVMSNPSLLKVVGVDDKEHYESNKIAYQQALKDSASFESFLRNSQNQVHDRLSSLSNDALRNFLDLKNRFHIKEISLGVYAKALSKIYSPFPSDLSKFLSASEIESQLDLPRIESERQAVLLALSHHLSDIDSKNLTRLSSQLQMGLISRGEFFSGFKSICEAKGIRIDRFRVFNNYIDYVLMTENIDEKKLFQNIDQVERSLTLKFAKSNEEKALVDKIQSIELAQKLENFELTADEWAAYKNNLNRFKPVWKCPFALNFEKFYEEADVRSERMIENVLGGESKNFDAKVLVAGGFHMSRITTILKGRNIPFVLLSPQITKISDEPGSAYLSAFSREKTPLEKLFQAEQISMNPPFLALGTNAPSVRPYKISFLALIAGLTLLNGGELSAKTSTVDLTRHPISSDVTVGVRDNNKVIPVTMALNDSHKFKSIDDFEVGEKKISIQDHGMFESVKEWLLKIFLSAHGKVIAAMGMIGLIHASQPNDTNSFKGVNPNLWRKVEDVKKEAPQIKRYRDFFDAIDSFRKTPGFKRFESISEFEEFIVNPLVEKKTISNDEWNLLKSTLHIPTTADLPTWQLLLASTELNDSVTNKMQQSIDQLFANFDHTKPVKLYFYKATGRISTSNLAPSTSAINEMVQLLQTYRDSFSKIYASGLFSFQKISEYGFWFWQVNNDGSEKYSAEKLIFRKQREGALSLDAAINKISFLPDSPFASELIASQHKRELFSLWSLLYYYTVAPYFYILFSLLQKKVDEGFKFEIDFESGNRSVVLDSDLAWTAHSQANEQILKGDIEGYLKSRTKSIEAFLRAHSQRHKELLTDRLRSDLESQNSQVLVFADDYFQDMQKYFYVPPKNTFTLAPQNIIYRSPIDELIHSWEIGKPLDQQPEMKTILLRFVVDWALLAEYTTTRLRSTEYDQARKEFLELLPGDKLFLMLSKMKSLRSSQGEVLSPVDLFLGWAKGLNNPLINEKLKALLPYHYRTFDSIQPVIVLEEKNPAVIPTQDVSGNKNEGVSHSVVQPVSFNNLFSKARVAVSQYKQIRSAENYGNAQTAIDKIMAIEKISDEKFLRAINLLIEFYLLNHENLHSAEADLEVGFEYVQKLRVKANSNIDIENLHRDLLKLAGEYFVAKNLFDPALISERLKTAKAYLDKLQTFQAFSDFVRDGPDHFQNFGKKGRVHTPLFELILIFAGLNTQIHSVTFLGVLVLFIRSFANRRFSSKDLNSTLVQSMGVRDYLSPTHHKSLRLLTVLGLFFAEPLYAFAGNEIAFKNQTHLIFEVGLSLAVTFGLIGVVNTFRWKYKDLGHEEETEMVEVSPGHQKKFSHIMYISSPLTENVVKSISNLADEQRWKESSQFTVVNELGFSEGIEKSIAENISGHLYRTTQGRLQIVFNQGKKKAQSVAYFDFSARQHSMQIKVMGITNKGIEQVINWLGEELLAKKITVLSEPERAAWFNIKDHWRKIGLLGVIIFGSSLLVQYLSAQPINNLLVAFGVGTSVLMAGMTGIPGGNNEKSFSAELSEIRNMAIRGDWENAKARLALFIKKYPSQSVSESERWSLSIVIEEFKKNSEEIVLRNSHAASLTQQIKDTLHNMWAISSELTKEIQDLNFQISRIENNFEDGSSESLQKENAQLINALRGPVIDRVKDSLRKFILIQHQAAGLTSHFTKLEQRGFITVSHNFNVLNQKFTTLQIRLNKIIENLDLRVLDNPGQQGDDQRTDQLLSSPMVTTSLDWIVGPQHGRGRIYLIDHLIAFIGFTLSTKSPSVLYSGDESSPEFQIKILRIKNYDIPVLQKTPKLSIGLADIYIRGRKPGLIQNDDFSKSIFPENLIENVQQIYVDELGETMYPKGSVFVTYLKSKDNKFHLERVIITPNGGASLFDLHGVNKVVEERMTQLAKQDNHDVKIFREGKSVVILYDNEVIFKKDLLGNVVVNKAFIGTHVDLVFPNKEGKLVLLDATSTVRLAYAQRPSTFIFSKLVNLTLKARNITLSPQESENLKINLENLEKVKIGGRSLLIYLWEAYENHVVIIPTFSQNSNDWFTYLIWSVKASRDAASRRLMRKIRDVDYTFTIPVILSEAPASEKWRITFSESPTVSNILMSPIDPGADLRMKERQFIEMFRHEVVGRHALTFLVNKKQISREDFRNLTEDVHEIASHLRDFSPGIEFNTIKMAELSFVYLFSGGASWTLYLQQFIKGAAPIGMWRLQAHQLLHSQKPAELVNKLFRLDLLSNLQGLLKAHTVLGHFMEKDFVHDSESVMDGFIEVPNFQSKPASENDGAYWFNGNQYIKHAGFVETVVSRILIPSSIYGLMSALWIGDEWMRIIVSALSIPISFYAGHIFRGFHVLHGRLTYNLVDAVKAFESDPVKEFTKLSALASSLLLFSIWNQPVGVALYLLALIPLTLYHHFVDYYLPLFKDIHFERKPLRAEEVLTEQDREKLVPQFGSFNEFLGNVGSLEEWKKSHPDDVLLGLSRHGESTSNLFKEPQTPEAYSPLTSRGLRQRSAFFNFAKMINLVFDWYGSSSLERAHQSLLPHTSWTGKNHHILPEMREVNLLPIGGISIYRIAQFYRLLIGKFDDDPLFYDSIDVPVAERLSRIKHLIDEDLLNRSEQTFLLTAHGRSIQWTMMSALGISFSKYRGVVLHIGSLENVAITVMSYSRKTQKWKLLVYNDNSFLPKDLQSSTKSMRMVFVEKAFFLIRALNRSFRKLFHLPMIKGITDQVPQTYQLLTPSDEQIRQMFDPYLKGASVPPAQNKNENSGVPFKSLIERIKKDFEVTSEQVRALTKDFIGQMDAKLSGAPSSLAMIKEDDVIMPTGDETGRSIVVSVGGTNGVIYDVELKGKGKFETKELPKIDLTDFRKRPGDLFEMFAKELKKIVGSDTTTPYAVGIVWAFPVKKENGKAINIELTKGWEETPDKPVIGQDIIALFNKAFQDQGMPNVSVSIVVNDTFNPMAVYTYEARGENPNAKAALAGAVLGTGENEATYIPGLGYFNLESGNYDFGTIHSQVTTAEDKILHEISPKGIYQFEKRVSGAYIGELFVSRVKAIAKETKRFSWLHLFEAKIDGSHLSRIGADQSANLDDVETMLRELFFQRYVKKSWAVNLAHFFKFKVSDLEEREVLKTVGDSIRLRSARLLASHYAGLALKADPELKEDHVIAIEGSLFNKSFEYSDKVKQALVEILGAEKAEKIHLVGLNKKEGIGAAILAVTAAKHQREELSHVVDVKPSSSASTPSLGKKFGDEMHRAIVNKLGEWFESLETLFSHGVNTHTQLLTLVYVNSADDMSQLQKVLGATEERIKNIPQANSYVGVVLTKSLSSELSMSVKRQISAKENGIVAVANESALQLNEGAYQFENLFEEFSKSATSVRAREFFSQLSQDKVEDKKVISIGSSNIEYQASEKLLSILKMILPIAGRYLLIDLQGITEAAKMA